MPQSLWAATAIDGPDCPTLEGNINADVAIIGAGLPGFQQHYTWRKKVVPLWLLIRGNPESGHQGETAAR